MPLDHTVPRLPQPPATTAARALLAQIRHLAHGIFHGQTARLSAQRDALFIFGVRVGSAGLLYLSQIVLARWMGATEYGIYVWMWTWVLVLGGLSHLGLGTGMIRLLPAYRAHGQLDLFRGLTIGGRSLALFVGSLMSLAAYGALRLFGGVLDEAYILPALLGVVCIPLFAMTDLQDGLGRANGWMSVALTPGPFKESAR